MNRLNPYEPPQGIEPPVAPLPWWFVVLVYVTLPVWLPLLFVVVVVGFLHIAVFAWTWRDTWIAAGQIAVASPFVTAIVLYWF